MASFVPSTFPCSDYKTVQIVLSAPSIAPANGYKIRWRIQGSTTWYDYPDQTGTTINVVGVPACYNIEVGITASCDGAPGTELIVSVQGTNSTCYVYALNDDTTYTFTPCGSNEPVNILITSFMTGVQRTVCARKGTVSGGSFTQTAECIG